ncbi:MAG TPA: diheme cytochrome c-553 [Casimicrobiaceae bacterium]|jgi:mono/diheme cytochrome c family protein
MQLIARWSAAALALTLLHAAGASAADKTAKASGDVKRGRYLVSYGGCHDCHTPKKMTPEGPQPDMSRALSGHPANAPLAPVPKEALGPGKWTAVANEHFTAWAGPWGVSFAANLTPDKRTGLGNWTVEQFIKTMRTGKHFGAGRPILPPMPWFNVDVLTDADLRAVFAYLMTLEPVDNPVPPPVPPK